MNFWLNNWRLYNWHSRKPQLTSRIPEVVHFLGIFGNYQRQWTDVCHEIWHLIWGLGTHTHNLIGGLGCIGSMLVHLWASLNGYFLVWVPKSLEMTGNFGHITSRSHFFMFFFLREKSDFFSIQSRVCLMCWKRSRHDGFLLCFTWTPDCSLNLDLQVI